MISDPAAITAIVDQLLAAHPAEVEAFRGGKTKLQGFFVGQLMKQTGGKADPKLANQILIEKPHQGGTDKREDGSHQEIGKNTA
jgi:aspartyl-tRNA(Asn)/glutamyl-tRNA(Gln) amidotransferase subunit B